MKVSLLAGTFLSFTSCCLCIPEDPYLLESDDLPRLDDGSVDDRLLAPVSNGHLATNVFSDTLFLDGVFNGRMGESCRARIRSIHASEFDFPGCPESPERLYRLDMRQAYVEEVISCPEAVLTYRTYAHSSLDRLLVSEVHVERVEDDASKEVIARRMDLSGEESADMEWQPLQHLDDDTFYKRGTTLVSETEDSEVRTVHIFYNGEVPSELILPAGEQKTSLVFLLSADVDQIRALQDFNQALALLASDRTGDALRSSHLDNWRSTWSLGNIVLEGPNVDLTLRETVASSLYNLYSNLPSFTSIDSDFCGLAPGGLARGACGQDYNGHVFWDMDVWILPTVVMFRPELAKVMLKYRIQRVGEAQKRATEGEYSGARYPWESAYTGAEVTPDLCPLCRENEQHITGDVSWGARTFLSATRDLEWLAEIAPGTDLTGEEFIHEMAAFWESRPTFNDEKGQWEINDVMPPDENQEHANNSIFTNVVANLAVSTARWTTCLASGEGAALAAIPDEWLDKMRNLVFLFNEEERYHEEYEGFDQQLQQGTLDPRGIKIADVVLLGYPLMRDMPDDVRRNDLELYESITTPDGPAMTWSMFAINWIDLDEREKADELFERSYSLYIREPFMVWTEKQSGIGAVNFITGMGGFLQALMFGYGGLRIRPYSLEFRHTFLPPSVEAMRFVGMQYLGAKFDLVLSEDEIELTCYQDPIELLQLSFSSGVVFPFLCNNAPQVFPRETFSLSSISIPSCDPPVDEILVNY